MISAKSKAKAMLHTKMEPVNTVKKVALGAETCWVPIRIKLLPTANPPAAPKARAAASNKRSSSGRTN